MGNDLIRALQRPFHDCAKHVMNSGESECSSDCCGSPCNCKFATHEVDDDDSLPVQERYPP